MSSQPQSLRLRRPVTQTSQPEKAARHTGILQDQVRRAARPPWSPSFSLALRMFLLIRVASATYSNIDDCDEVYNFWEPLHFLHRGYGFQTWEVSPKYAIRSWAYILLHLPIAHVGFLLSGGGKRAAFFAVRMLLGLCSSFVEATLYRRVYQEVNERVGRYLLFMLLFNAGMWNASTALLPSTFAMYAATYAFALTIGPAALQHRYRTYGATLLFATGAIVGWPFSIALAIPFVFEELFIYGRDRVPASMYRSWVLSRWKRLIGSGILASLIFIPVVGIDSLAYGKLAVVPWNIVSYNLLSPERGPNLYGTSPWSFYILNLLLNFNVLFVLAILAGPILLLTYVFDKKRLGANPTSEESCPFNILTVKLAPFYLWYYIVASQEHKEERFMFPVYPMICFNAAIALYLIRGLMETAFISVTKSPYKASQTSIFSIFTLSVISCSVLISVSRIMANWNYYHAPLDIAYLFEKEELPLLLNSSSLLEPPLSSHWPSLHNDDRQHHDDHAIDLTPVKYLELTYCIAKEWHRFPGHFFVPDGIRVEFVKSAFDGMLPGHFLQDETYTHPFSPTLDTWWSRPQSRYTPSGLNDMNREDPSVYVPISQCSYLVDLDFPSHPSNSPQEPRYSVDDKTWERVSCRPFIDAAHSPLLSRTLWLPGEKWKQLNQWGDYCLLKNRKQVDSKVAKAKKEQGRQ